MGNEKSSALQTHTFPQSIAPLTLEAMDPDWLIIEILVRNKDEYLNLPLSVVQEKLYPILAETYGLHVPSKKRVKGKRITWSTQEEPSDLDVAEPAVEEELQQHTQLLLNPVDRGADRHVSVTLLEQKMMTHIRKIEDMLRMNKMVSEQVLKNVQYTTGPSAVKFVVKPIDTGPILDLSPKQGGYYRHFYAEKEDSLEEKRQRKNDNQEGIVITGDGLNASIALLHDELSEEPTFEVLINTGLGRLVAHEYMHAVVAHIMDGVLDFDKVFDRLLKHQLVPAFLRTAEAWYQRRYFDELVSNSFQRIFVIAILQDDHISTLSKHGGDIMQPNGIEEQITKFLDEHKIVLSEYIKILTLANGLIADLARYNAMPDNAAEDMLEILGTPLLYNSRFWTKEQFVEALYILSSGCDLND